MRVLIIHSLFLIHLCIKNNIHCIQTFIRKDNLHYYDVKDFEGQWSL